MVKVTIVPLRRWWVGPDPRRYLQDYHGGHLEMDVETLIEISSWETKQSSNPAGQCQDLMEDGGVIEDLPNPTFPLTIGGFTYHPQTEALLPWFEFKSPSFALNGAYSYPDETVLTALCLPQALNCGL